MKDSSTRIVDDKKTKGTRICVIFGSDAVQWPNTRQWYSCNQQGCDSLGRDLAFNEVASWFNDVTHPQRKDICDWIQAGYAAFKAEDERRVRDATADSTTTITVEKCGHQHFLCVSFGTDAKQWPETQWRYSHGKAGCMELGRDLAFNGVVSWSNDVQVDRANVCKWIQDGYAKFVANEKQSGRDVEETSAAKIEVEKRGPWTGFCVRFGAAAKYWPNTRQRYSHSKAGCIALGRDLAFNGIESWFNEFPVESETVDKWIREGYAAFKEESESRPEAAEDLKKTKIEDEEYVDSYRLRVSYGDDAKHWPDTQRWYRNSKLGCISLGRDLAFNGLESWINDVKVNRASVCKWIQIGRDEFEEEEGTRAEIAEVLKKKAAVDGGDRGAQASAAKKERGRSASLTALVDIQTVDGKPQLSVACGDSAAKKAEQPRFYPLTSSGYLEAGAYLRSRGVCGWYVSDAAQSPHQREAFTCDGQELVMQGWQAADKPGPAKKSVESGEALSQDSGEFNANTWRLFEFVQVNVAEGIDGADKVFAHSVVRCLVIRNGEVRMESVAGEHLASFPEIKCSFRLACLLAALGQDNDAVRAELRKGLSMDVDRP